MNRTKVLLVEDEELFAGSFEQILKDIEPTFDVTARLDSVTSAVKWLNENSADLIFLDIQLSDGLSFEIFEKVKVDSPIIFLTSYDQFAIKAFKLNSLDYLLKPININELKRALEKYKKYALTSSGQIDYKQLVSLITGRIHEYKKRYVVYIGEKIKYIETENIAYFFILERDVYMRDKEGGTYPIDFSLDKLQLLLDPEHFFRINRRYIINISSIKNMFTLSKSNFKIELSPKPDEDTIVSLSRSADFRRWLNQ